MSSGDTAPRQISRVIDVLLAVASGNSRLANISEASGLPVSTVHRLLHGMSYRELVLYDEVSREYRLGPGCVQLAAPIFDRSSGLGLFAGTSLEKLRLDVGQTVTMHMRLEGWRVCVSEIPSIRPLRYVIGIGSYAPVWTGASGRVLLAYSPEAVQRRAFEACDAQRRADGYGIIGDALQRDVAAVLTDGWAIAHGEVTSGVAGISVPVVDQSTDRILLEPLALSAIGPELEMYQNKEMIIDALRKSAQELAARRGWRSSYDPPRLQAREP